MSLTSADCSLRRNIGWGFDNSDRVDPQIPEGTVMTTTPVRPALAAATAFASVSISAFAWLGLAPTAHASPLDAPRNYVASLRAGGTQCRPLTYQIALENMAQNYARTENVASLSGGYHGYTTGYLGSGDPAQQAIDSAISKAKPGIEDCSNTDYGVGYVRHDDRSVDVVTIVFGRAA
jgi:hypothetical protein